MPSKIDVTMVMQLAKPVSFQLFTTQSEAGIEIGELIANATIPVGTLVTINHIDLDTDAVNVLDLTVVGVPNTHALTRWDSVKPLNS